MDKPQKVIAKVINKKALNPKILFTEFQYIEPNKISFEPGQFVSLKVAMSLYRSYSFCSDYKDTTKFSLITDVDTNGIGSNYVSNLQVNDEIEFIGPSGKFQLKRPFLNKIILFATGTGIAPFISYLYKLRDYKYEGEIKLYFGLRYEKDIFFLDRLSEYRNFMKNFTYQIYLSKPQEQGPFKTGRISQEVDNNIFTDAHYYLCGHPEMIEEMTRRFLMKGITDDRVFTEKFTWANS